MGQHGAVIGSLDPSHGEAIKRCMTPHRCLTQSHSCSSGTDLHGQVWGQHSRGLRRCPHVLLPTLPSLPALPFSFTPLLSSSPTLGRSLELFSQALQPLLHSTGTSARCSSGAPRGCPRCTSSCVPSLPHPALHRRDLRPEVTMGVLHHVQRHSDTVTQRQW